MNSLYTLRKLTGRSCKIFLLDKAAVFFSLLAPLIILLLYVLFLKQIQVDTVNGYLQGFEVEQGAVKAFVDSWMLTGVMSVACITVSLSANTVMVQDKTRGIANDGLASPVKSGVITAAYLLFNVLATVIIASIVLCVCFIYLLAMGEFYLTFSDITGIIGTMLLSTLSAAAITVFITGFFKSEAALSAFIGIVSAVIGFVIGAYMPVSIFPKAVQYAVGFFPGTYSAGLFRSFFMQGALDRLTKGLPAEAAQRLEQAYAMRTEFFGHGVGGIAMAAVLLLSAVLFVLLFLFIGRRLRRSKLS